MASVRFAAMLLFGGVHSGASGVQVPAPPMRIAVGFGVDTARSPQREIFALYRSYLAHLGDSIRPNPFWSEAEQQRWRGFDLVSSYVYQGFTNFTVVHLAPAVGLDSTYLIRALVASVDDSTRDVRLLALYRLYAIREAGRWVLANALPRLTRTWHRETITSVTFVYPPGWRFARSRAEASAAFVDSLARAFQLPPPRAIEYYVTGDLIETFGAMGLDFFPIGADTVGGRANVGDDLVFVGSSTNSESYRHELAHVVLAPLAGGGRTHPLIMEGLMTWTGGSAGLDFTGLLPGLKAYLQTHPALTLEIVMATPPPRAGSLDVGYDGAAVLCAMVYDKGGVAAIRELVTAGPEASKALDTASRLLGVSRDDLDKLWRKRVLAY